MTGRTSHSARINARKSGGNMRITPDERDHLLEIIRDEIEASGRRIAERLGGMGARVPDGNENRWESVRRFYEDLSGKVWSEGDEECLASLGDVTESEVKSAMREAFRKSPVHPLPSFRYLLNLSRRPEAVTISARSRNPDAISAADRERLANLLAEQLA